MPFSSYAWRLSRGSRAVAVTRPAEHRKLRHALEIRHESFLTKEFVDVPRTYDVALVCADTVEWPRRLDLALYVRFRLLPSHGSEVLYARGYGKSDLDDWAKRVAFWATGKEPSDAGRIIAHPASKREARDVFR
jgi:uncharacterized protein YecE (DUF72 family)